VLFAPEDELEYLEGLLEEENRNGRVAAA